MYISSIETEKDQQLSETKNDFDQSPKSNRPELSVISSVISRIESGFLKKMSDQVESNAKWISLNTVTATYFGYLSTASESNWQAGCKESIVPASDYTVEFRVGKPTPLGQLKIVHSDDAIEQRVWQLIVASSTVDESNRIRLNHPESGFLDSFSALI